LEKEEREEDGIRGDEGQNILVPGCGDVILLVEVGCDEIELRADPPSAAKVAESCRATGSENEVGGGSAPECGDELLAEFDCDEQSDEPDLCLFIFRSGRTLPVSDMVPNFSSRSMSAA
jgi:hypothetical protein